MAKRKAENEKQKKLIKCYLTEKENVLLEVVTERLGISKSEVLRRAFTNAKMPQEKKKNHNDEQGDLREAAIYQLSKIGTNMNQIAHAANLGVTQRKELEDTLFDLKCILSELKEE